MRAVIYVFSGTGNTRRVAELYKENFLKAGVETVIYDIHTQKTDKGFVYREFPDPKEFDIVGLGYPVHGFNAPKVVNDFTKLLPAIEQGDKKTFIFKSSGEGLTFNNYSSQKIIPRMQRKGYTFLTERHFVMPYNMIFRHTDDMVKSEWIYAKKLAAFNSKEILEGKKEKVRYCPLRYWFVPVVRIEWIYAQLQGPAMKVDNKKCIKCMKCVKNCPLENITYDSVKDRFRFGTHCALCVCCSFGCPTKAISIGLLNNWRVNGDYKILEKASDDRLDGAFFGENLKGLKRWLYYKYYRRLDKMFEQDRGGKSVVD